MLVTFNFASSTSAPAKTFSACQMPSTEAPTTPGVNGTGMPPCG